MTPQHAATGTATARQQAATTLHYHRPVVARPTWRRRWGFVPWRIYSLRVCRICGQSWPCTPAFIAETRLNTPTMLARALSRPH